MFNSTIYCFIFVFIISTVINVSNGNVIKRSVEENDSETKTDHFKPTLIPHDALNILADPSLDSPLNEIKRTVNVIQQKRDFIQSEDAKIPVPVDIEQLRKVAQILGIIINEIVPTITGNGGPSKK